MVGAIFVLVLVVSPKTFIPITEANNACNQVFSGSFAIQDMVGVRIASPVHCFKDIETGDYFENGVWIKQKTERREVGMIEVKP